jgi:hypothetical protein
MISAIRAGRASPVSRVNIVHRLRPSMLRNRPPRDSHRLRSRYKMARLAPSARDRSASNKTLISVLMS